MAPMTRSEPEGGVWSYPKPGASWQPDSEPVLVSCAASDSRIDLEEATEGEEQDASTSEVKRPPARRIVLGVLATVSLAAALIVFRDGGTVDPRSRAPSGCTIELDNLHARQRMDPLCV
jgi:hypothetical protein